MKTRHFLMALFAALVLAGCYNDDKLWDAVDTQGQRIEALESWQKLASSNIEALQTLVGGREYITDVTPVTLAGDTVGYTIAFHAHEAVTIYYGATGDKGDRGATGTPGTPGTDGEPAPVPRLRTGQALTDAGIAAPAGAWTPDAIYLSVDNGATWTLVSGRNGTDGAAWFTGVDATGDDSVVFTLAATGEAIRVPRYKALRLTFAYQPEGADAPQPIDPATAGVLATFDRLDITYAPAGSGILTANVRVAALVPRNSGWTVAVDPATATISLVAPEDEGTTDLLISATDNAGHACSYQLAIKKGYPGNGTAEDPFLIPSHKGLMYFVRQINDKGQEYSGQFFKLTKDIVLTEQWTPIGPDNNSNCFCGNLDGGGHSISELKVNSKYAGLFYNVYGGSLKNITLVSPEVEGEDKCGALAAQCGKATVENCYVKKGKCTSPYYAGGLIGTIWDCNITNCHVEETVISDCAPDDTYAYAGGLIGEISSGINNITGCSATRCSTTATVPATSINHRAMCGGLIGGLDGEATIEACYSTGSLTSSHCEGGLVGGYSFPNASRIIKGCYSSCTADNESDFHDLSASGYYWMYSIEACYYLTTYTGQPDETGITFQPDITPDMIAAMNAALGADSEFQFDADGTLTKR